MREIKEAIANAKQGGVSPERVRVFKRELKQMRELLAEECRIAWRVDPKVPMVRKEGQRWEAYSQEVNDQPMEGV